MWKQLNRFASLENPLVQITATSTSCPPLSKLEHLTKRPFWKCAICLEETRGPLGLKVALWTLGFQLHLRPHSDNWLDELTAQQHFWPAHFSHLHFQRLHPTQVKILLADGWLRWPEMLIRGWWPLCCLPTLGPESIRISPFVKTQLYNISQPLSPGTTSPESLLSNSNYATDHFRSIWHSFNPYLRIPFQTTLFFLCHDLASKLFDLCLKN